MIKPISFAKFPQAGEIKTLTEIINLVDEKAEVEALPEALANLLEALKIKMQEVDASFKPTIKSELTEVINELDEQRKNLLIMLNTLLKANQRHWEKESELAANRILNTLNTYGREIYNLKYHEEAAIVTQLTAELRNNAQLVADCTLLHLNELIDKIEEVNTEFDSVWRSRQNSSAELKKLRPVSEVLEEAKEQYVELIQVLNALLTLASTPALEEIAMYHDSYKEKLMTA